MSVRRPRKQRPYWPLLVGAFSVALGGCSDEIRTRDLTELALAAERVVSPFETSPETSRLVRRASDAVSSLDASSLYAALPAEADLGAGLHRARRILFEAHLSENRRLLRSEIPKSPASVHDLFETRSIALDGPGEAPGDGWLLIAVLPLDNPARDYRLRATSALSTGAGDPFAVWRSLPAGLRLLEKHAVRVDGPDQVTSSLAAHLQRRFPSTMAFARRYLQVRRVASPSHSPRRRDVDLTVRLRFAPLAASYPQVSAFLSRVARSVRGSGALQDDHGATLASWRIGTPEEGVSVGFALEDGRLASRSEGPAVDLLSPLRLRFVYTASVERYGVKTTIEGIRGVVRTDPTLAAPMLSVEVNGEPTRLTVEGALLGVVPVEVVDILIPGNLKDGAKSILSTLLRGRDGRGVELSAELQTEAPGTHFLESTLLSDVPSGELARIALRLGATLMQANADERADLLRLWHDLIDRFQEDLSSPVTAASG